LDCLRIRKKLLRWFDLHQRDLPWRVDSDPYRVWISEIMLQQTRVAVVIPFYERFLAHLPDVQVLANVDDTELLRLWTGLGYYSRARNLKKAAQVIVARGSFPDTYDDLLRLPGIGPYTAGAIASIALGRAHVAIDGNVRRVVTRLAGDAAVDVEHEAQRLLDRERPGAWNQALMELGATICVPGTPECDACPVRDLCGAFAQNLQSELPVKCAKPKLTLVHRTFLIIRKSPAGTPSVLVVPSPRVADFWDLPEPFPEATVGALVGTIRHAITTTQYVFAVHEGVTQRTPPGARWVALSEADKLPLSTASKKALACLETL
jgi:A/G-specific adenine glycosylase